VAGRVTRTEEEQQYKIQETYTQTTTKDTQITQKHRNTDNDVSLLRDTKCEHNLGKKHR
jgi:hypothetical protein